MLRAHTPARTYSDTGIEVGPTFQEEQHAVGMASFLTKVPARTIWRKKLSYDAVLLNKIARAAP